MAFLLPYRPDRWGRWRAYGATDGVLNHPGAAHRVPYKLVPAMRAVGLFDIFEPVSERVRAVIAGV